MNLMQASKQWATRPDDERYWDLEEMMTSARFYHKSARTAKVPYSDIQIEPEGSELVMKGASGQAVITHDAFGQLCAKVKAPASFLRALPVENATADLNSMLAVVRGGFGSTGPDTDAHLLLHENGGYFLRAITGQSYSRLWNDQVIEWLQRVSCSYGALWKVPPARPVKVGAARTRIATKDDVLEHAGGTGALSIKVGDTIGPAGLYCSNHDMFAFLVDDSKRIKAGNRSLSRGFFAWNAETYGVSFGFSTFLFDAVCGNHIVWGAEEMKEVRLRHVGDVQSRALRTLRFELREFVESAAGPTEAKIKKAIDFELGSNEMTTLDAVFKVGVPRVTAKKAYDLVQDAGDNPRSAWGLANGLTVLSQGAHGDSRMAVDRLAAKVLEVAF